MADPRRPGSNPSAPAGAKPPPPPSPPMPGVGPRYVAAAPAMEPMAPAVTDALVDLPGGAEVDPYRRIALGRVGALARVMRQAEAAHAAQRITARHLAELWAWAAYLEHVRGYRSDTTVQQYLGSLTRFLAWCVENGHAFAQLKLPDFHAWQMWLSIHMRHGPSWRMRQIAAVRNFFQWRAESGMGANLAANLRGPHEPIGMARKYTVAQLKSMLAEVGKQQNEALRIRDKALLLVLLATGGRREELSKLDIRSFTIGQRTGVVRFHGKGAKQREVPFEGPVIQAINDWLVVRNSLPFPCDPDAMFVGCVGVGRGCRMRPRAIERRVGSYAKAGGLREWGVHRFRVTFATTLYDDGAGIEEIRVLMGHESIETTRRYLAVSERSRRTRMKADRQHEVLGTRNTGQPRWMRAALGDL